MALHSLVQPSQVMINVIWQELLPIRLITATTYHVTAAQQGTSSVWRAAHDYSCWRGGSACCQGLFWGQPANRGAFLITVRNLETTLTLWVMRPLDQGTNLPYFWRPDYQNERSLCILCTLKILCRFTISTVSLLTPQSLKTNNI